MIGDICVDASFIVPLLIPEHYTDQAVHLWDYWTENQKRIVSPYLIGYEVTSAIYRKVYRGLIQIEDGQVALEKFTNMNIELIHLPILHSKAWAFAKQFNRPNTYDAHYLALADHLDCPFWTADERLFNAINGKLTWVEWIEKKEF